MCKKTNYHGTSNTQIDKCIRPLIEWLNETIEYPIIASCCGHNKYPITVIVKYKDNKSKILYYELFSWTKIPRTRRFYVKDKGGYYYIPEISKEFLK